MASDHTSYLPLEGYDPIIVDAENLFRDNNAVYLYSLDRYQLGQSMGGDTGSNVLSTDEWDVGVNPAY